MKIILPTENQETKRVLETNNKLYNEYLMLMFSLNGGQIVYVKSFRDSKHKASARNLVLSIMQ